MSDAVTTLMQRVGGWRRIATLGVGVASVAAIIGLSRWAGAPTWVPMATNIPLETSAQIDDRLTQAGIPHRLERGGADISVAVADLPRARVAVAKDGLIESGRPGLELFDKPAYAMTDFTQRINYRRALEGELERTIGKMQNVASAKVHLAIHESSAFLRTQSPSEASVVLSLKGDASAPADVVRGVAQLVASSVDGLDSDNVTIVDQRGRLLSRPDDRLSLSGLTSRQLEVQQEVEQHFSRKAEAIAERMVGTGNARVEVAATLNFDKIARTTQILDPDRQVATIEQKAEIIPGAQGGAGSSNQATQYENSKTTESFDGAVGNVTKLAVAVVVNDRQIGAGDSATFETRTPAELARLDTLVKRAVGFDSARGDQVSVMSVPFALPQVVEEEIVPPPGLVQRVQQNQGLLFNSIGLVLAFVVATMALKSLRQPVATSSGRALASGSREGGVALPPGYDREDADSFRAPPALSDGRAPELAPELAALQANQEIRHRATQTVQSQPEVASKLIRSWLREA